MAPLATIPPDILSSLSGLKKVELLQLMHRFNSGQMQIQEFIAHLRVLLGQRVYNQLTTALNEIGKKTREMVHQQSVSSMSPRDLLAPGLRALESALKEEPLKKLAPSVPTETPITCTPSAVVEREPKVTKDTSTDDGDVTKMDTDSLQDILQYSGIDLRAEANAILQQQEYLLSQVAHSSGNDPQARANLLFNIEFLKTVISSIATKYRLVNSRNWNPKIMEYLLYALQNRISGIVDELVYISRVRVDVLRARFKMKIDNDPRRQLFVLDKVLGYRNQRFVAPSNTVISVVSNDDKGDDLISKRSRLEYNPSLTTAEIPGMPAIAPENLVGPMAKDEQIIRSRLTNAAALTQLGVPLKSWMIPGAANPNVSHQDTSKIAPTRTPSVPIVQQHHGIASPPSIPNAPLGPVLYGISDKEWRATVLERKIILQDIVFLMSHDKEFSHLSIFTKALASLK